MRLHLGMCVLDLTFIPVNPLPMCFHSYVYLLAVNKCSLLNKEITLSYILLRVATVTRAQPSSYTAIILRWEHIKLKSRLPPRADVATVLLGWLLRRTLHLQS